MITVTTTTPYATHDVTLVSQRSEEGYVIANIKGNGGEKKETDHWVMVMVMT